MGDLDERIQKGLRAIALATQRGLDTSEWQRHLDELLAEAGQNPTREEGLDPWMLREWRRVSIPEWRRILRESMGKGDKRRQEYACWMLREILLDPEYE